MESVNGGWPAYEFSDGSGTSSGIARNPDGSSTVRLVSKGISESSNRLTVEFQDEANEYQQDTLSVLSDDDQALIGYEVGSTSTALGLPNFNQALRILSRQIQKATKGNRFIEFGTSFRALKVRPGDIIALTYLKEGLTRTPFRVVKLAPSVNYRNVAILAQAHDDSWYNDDPGNGSGGGRQPGAGAALPRPLLGPVFGADGSTQFSISESTTSRTDGGAATILTIGFVKPTQPLAGAPIVPLVSLAPQVLTSGGSLKGGDELLLRAHGQRWRRKRRLVVVHDSSGDSARERHKLSRFNRFESAVDGGIVQCLSWDQSTASLSNCL